MTPSCTYCGAPISQEADYRKVTGYERIKRSAGGTNGLRQREPTEEFACTWCIGKLAKGIAVGQASLM